MFIQLKNIAQDDGCIFHEPTLSPPELEKEESTPLLDQASYLHTDLPFGDLTPLTKDIIEYLIMSFLLMEDIIKVGQLNHAFNKLVNGSQYYIGTLDLVRDVHMKTPNLYIRLHDIYDLTYHAIVLLYSALSLPENVVREKLQHQDIKLDVIEGVLNEIKRKAKEQKKESHLKDANEKLKEKKATLKKNMTTYHMLQSLTGENTEYFCTIPFSARPLWRGLITILLFDLVSMTPYLISFLDPTLLNWLDEKISGEKYDGDGYSYMDIAAITFFSMSWIGAFTTLFFGNRLSVWRDEQLIKIQNLQRDIHHQEETVSRLKNKLSSLRSSQYVQIHSRFFNFEKLIHHEDRLNKMTKEEQAAIKEFLETERLKIASY